MQRDISAAVPQLKSLFERRRPKRARQSPKTYNQRIKSERCFHLIPMSKRALSIFTFFTLSILGGVCFADQRHFTFVYEATIEEPGEFELESWVTGQIRKGADHSFSEIDFRHEIELGVTHKLQASVYLADWSHVSSKENNGFAFSD